MIPRICRKTYLQFLHDFFVEMPKGKLPDNVGREFLRRHFPGIEDPDVSEEINYHRATSLIEERYVQSHG